MIFLFGAQAQSALAARSLRSHLVAIGTYSKCQATPGCVRIRWLNGAIYMVARQ
jgi:hypothetical protein